MIWLWVDCTGNIVAHYQKDTEKLEGVLRKSNNKKVRVLEGLGKDSKS